MTKTTSYGTWLNHGDSMALTVEQTVEQAFGAEGPAGFDVDAIAREYREAINNALPDGVSLAGDEFIGPAYAEDRHFDGYPADEDGRLDIKAIVEDIDLWAIVARHEISPDN